MAAEPPCTLACSLPSETHFCGWMPWETLCVSERTETGQGTHWLSVIQDLNVSLLDPEPTPPSCLTALTSSPFFHVCTIPWLKACCPSECPSLLPFQKEVGRPQFSAPNLTSCSFRDPSLFRTSLCLLSGMLVASGLLLPSIV